ncbi:Hypothetical predicted protein [Octopus vulgaris]|uniref:Uncharacterized protein n=1 Tax=Octopus vulgaris TaxID=6645 RepID=A0AA36MJ57_OCTVU|nr:Hypothetical predicted protein [Octopus vulgaris]
MFDGFIVEYRSSDVRVFIEDITVMGVDVPSLQQHTELIKINVVLTMADAGAKKKHRQYNVKYLKYGFIPLLHSKQLPFHQICEKTFSNEAMKP